MMWKSFCALFKKDFRMLVSGKFFFPFSRVQQKNLFLLPGLRRAHGLDKPSFVWPLSCVSHPKVPSGYAGTGN